MNLATIQESINKFGVSKTLFDLFYKSVNTITYGKILQGMTVTMDTLDPRYLEGPEHYTYQILTAKQIADFARDPHNNLPAEFLEYADAKGDECYAILDGDRLAAYGWYSWKPTRISKELTLMFSPPMGLHVSGFHPSRLPWPAASCHWHGTRITTLYPTGL